MGLAVRGPLAPACRFSLPYPEPIHVLDGREHALSRPLVALALAALLLALGIGNGSGQTVFPALDGEIAIGGIWSLSGPAAPYGVAQIAGAELAVEEINGVQLLGQSHLRLISENDQSTAEGAQRAMTKLVEQDRVAAVLGPTLSDSAKAADPIAQANGVVVLGVSNTADGIVEIGDFIFRNSLPERAVQPAAIRITADRLGFRRAGMIYADDSIYSLDALRVFQAALAKQGILVVSVEPIKTGDEDFTEQIAHVLAAEPDVIVVTVLVEDAARILRQAQRLGVPESVRIIGGNNFNTPVLIELAGPAAEGAISGTAWLRDAETPRNQAFVAAYAARYGSPPDQFAAQAYAGVYLLAHAIHDSGSRDSTAIRDALMALKDVDTVLGVFSFQPNREPIYEPMVQVVRNATFTRFQE
ncbi:MAG: amino acid/amide transporter substrate-binding protein, family [Chloroflexi bacterium]|nr:amino acid/amide transporter substrate-binding protein, family [Chloroflexota bacterium]